MSLFGQKFGENEHTVVFYVRAHSTAVDVILVVHSSLSSTTTKRITFKTLVDITGRSSIGGKACSE